MSYAQSDLEQLLLPFTKISSIHFSYTETRSSMFFKKAQVSSGEIQFIQPDRIIKRVIKPQYQEFDIDKEQLTIRSLSKPDRQININQYPQLKHFVLLIKAVLSGDSQYLRQHYTIALTTQNESIAFWLLSLIPRDFPDQIENKSIQSIAIKGKDGQITAIKMQGFAGESSELIIDKIM